MDEILRCVLRLSEKKYLILFINKSESTLASCSRTQIPEEYLTFIGIIEN